MRGELVFAANKYVFLQRDDKIFTPGPSVPVIIQLLLRFFYFILFIFFTIIK